jgi:serine protease Do
MIAEYPLDHPASFKIRRNGERLALSLTVMEYPPAKMAGEYPFETTSARADNVGLQTENLTPGTRKRLNIAQNTSGVEVGTVPPGSAADRVGLHEGDVVLRVQGQPASSPVVVQQQLKLAETGNRPQLALLVLGQDGPRWVALPVGASNGR